MWDPKRLNKQQTKLRRLIARTDRYDQAIALIFRQHALLHSAGTAGSEAWSFKDEILDGMSEAHIRRSPSKAEHSVAWCQRHIARIENLAMNLLVAGSPQVFHQTDWQDRLGVKVRDNGNAMDGAAVAELSAGANIPALRA